MTINSISGRDHARTDYTQDEVAAMRQDASTSKVLNTVRRDTGSSKDVEIRGDDKSVKELRKEYSEHGVAAEIGVTGAHTAIEMAAAGTEAVVAGGVAAGAGMVLFTGVALKGLAQANERNAELTKASDKDATRAAMVATLDLPQGYKNIELARLDAINPGFQSGTMKMGTTLMTRDHKEAAVLQLHADRGMNAARDLVAGSKITREGGAAEVAKALAANPALKAKYDSDAAFKTGFDSLVWAKQRGTDADYDTAIKHLDARDARYEQHHIQYRV
jgi:hypothetical protein